MGGEPGVEYFFKEKRRVELFSTRLFYADFLMLHSNL